MPSSSHTPSPPHHLYTPQSHTTSPYVWREMVTELLAGRELVWRLVIRDLTARYKQSFLGLLWAFLAPLVMTTVFVLIKRSRLIQIPNTDIPYPVFVFTGQTVWLLFANSLIQATNSLTSAGQLLTKINFPRETIIVSSVGQPIFDFALRIPIIIVLAIFYGTAIQPSIIFLPIVLLPLILLVIGAGFILSMFNTIFHDIGNAIGIIIHLAMFATPVVYPPPEKWPLSFLINHMNPVSPFITAARDIIYTGKITNGMDYLSSVILSILLFLVGWRVFHIAESLLAERA